VCASASTRWHRGKTDTVARLSPPSDHALSRWYLCRSSIRRHFGGDILNRFEVTLDLQHDSMYLKPERTFQPDAYEFVTIGIQFFKSNADAFSVVAVWKHSPAEEAGVVIGDRIVAVNGHSAVDLDLQAFVDQLHGPAGTPIVMEIERPTGKIVLNLKTRQLVCQPGAPR